MASFTITAENQKALENIHQVLDNVTRALVHDAESVAVCFGYGQKKLDETRAEQDKLIIQAVDMDKRKYEIIHQIYDLQADIKALQNSVK